MHPGLEENMEERPDLSRGRLVVVSNRLPYVVRRSNNGGWELEPGSGGLVTALLPVLRDHGGTWIGWSGATQEIPDLPNILRRATREEGYVLRPVSISAEEMDGYYHGYSNETLWPLFHDLQSQCNFVREYWHTYVRVNRRFAEAIAEECRPEDFAWVHDYQLMDVGYHLRELGCSSNLSFFLHIPFPPPDIFLKLPERHALLSSLLAYDFVGLQTQRDRRNLVQCIRALIRDSRVRANGHLRGVRIDGRETQIGSFPIGIDALGFARRAALPHVDAMVTAIKEHFRDQQLILGVDRLDYTKGIPQRLEAFRNLLERFPEVRGHVTLIQVVVPSRTGVPKYDALKLQIDRLVGEINGRYTTMGWVPVHYMFRSLGEDELLAYYRACGIGLVTPLKDGMNLVCKEFVACSHAGDSVLILSQFAGAAAQLGRSALLVNPYDVEQTADAIYLAVRMLPNERRARMRKLQRNVRQQDIFWWVDSFMRAAIDRELKDFPMIEEYVPEYHGEDPLACTDSEM